MKAVILAAGYGTRLKELTKEKSKALLEIAGKPLIGHIIERIPKEIRDIYIVTNAKFFSQFQRWLNNFQQQNKQNGSKNIAIINDGTTSNENRLGGIGDLALAIEKIGIDDLLVLASDNLFDFGLEEIYGYFKKNNKDAIVLYDVKEINKVRLFGEVKIDENNKIIGFVEKPSQPSSTLVSTGIYFFTKNSIALLKDYLKEGKSKEGPGNFVRWIINKKEVYGYIAKGRWYDIGSKESYEEARKSW